MLKFDHVTKQFGELAAIDDVTFEVKPGIITAVIGPNGAGKSTLVNMAAGSYGVTSGRILVGDTELQKLPKYRIAHAGLSRTYQNIRLFDGMSVVKNLEVALVPPRVGSLIANTFGLSGRAAAEERRARCHAVLERLGLAAYAERQAGSLAYGQQKLVELARAIVAEPRVLLLDEPAAGLNHGETEQLKQHILALRAPDLAMVLIEHDMKLIMSISDTIVVMNRGRVLAQGTASEIRTNTEVQEAYLGQPGAIKDIEAAARGRRNRVRIREGEGLTWHQP
ncbi:ABC transporter ATP-binding protein [Ancylobacter defluvii]|uniref:ABC transporter ATP-binding protein n=1 Tax=Ancylobacter defluvii TaxID=1282440 RepID=A0A9W6K0H9_9HYPH|nr:ABC transporter ATP-binding protein [Ancylobacter defluvii]MBS7589071.1 ABC transporter ATP-binding protein [Ancylobacter defluvii]GLK84683.1 ABC transporter ATP-binding protein [Ancylobacter defluvii]